MADTLAAPVAGRREYPIAIALFAALLVFHTWAATRNWRSTDLPGNGFRQTQTAISALFIQREHNFSLAYPTPVLGKPWSIPFEFPLYQWTTVVVSNTTGLALVKSGRAVSLACFYLSLPALWLLLGRLGVAPPRRLVVLGLVLSCPLYIFYARAFLIETMALMFALWFLQAFVAAIERHSVAWLLVANVAGIGAGLVKVTMTCKHDVKRISIDPSLLAEDKDMLEDLVAAAFNAAVRKAEETSAERMGKITAGMPGLPGGMKFPF